MRYVKVIFQNGKFSLASNSKKKYLDLDIMRIDLFGREKVKFKILSVNGNKFNKANLYIYKKKENSFLVETKSGKTKISFESKSSMDRFFISYKKFVHSGFNLSTNDDKDFETTNNKNKKAVKYSDPKPVLFVGPHASKMFVSTFGGSSPIKRTTKGGCNYLINGKKCGRVTQGIDDKCDLHN